MLHANKYDVLSETSSEAKKEKINIVGRNNTEHISEKNLECDSLECQNAIKIKGIWNGILIKACS